MSLVRRRKEGREVWCALVIAPLGQAASWIEEQRRFWNVRLGLTHDRFPNAEAKEQHVEGWNGCLARLERLF